jgi:hypothetical protein
MIPKLPLNAYETITSFVLRLLVCEVLPCATSRLLVIDLPIRTQSVSNAVTTAVQRTARILQACVQPYPLLW